jgi:formylglycine-generating enzyme required for sulfatase activity
MIGKRHPIKFVSSQRTNTTEAVEVWKQTFRLWLALVLGAVVLCSSAYGAAPENNAADKSAKTNVEPDSGKVLPPKVEAKTPPPGDVAEVEIGQGVKMKFCWVPPGKATLGSPGTEKERGTDEIEHEFTTKGFWLGKFDVTQREWLTVMGGQNPSSFVPAYASIKAASIIDTSRFPVENVSWYDCQEFLKKLNDSVQVPARLGKGKFALPHEDEWEYACRGGKGNKTAFYFGSELNGKQANCDGNSPYGIATKGPYLKQTSEVGSDEKMAPHPWGLCDMQGNVWQWCANTRSGWDRALRGGSWLHEARLCRAAYHYVYYPDNKTPFVGFRLARVPSEQ